MFSKVRVAAAVRRSSIRLAPIALLILTAHVIGGCADPRMVKTEDPESALPTKTSVYALARRLGLTVTESSSTTVTLRNTCNTVVVFCDPGGRAFVNGQAVGPVGGYVMAGSILYVPVGAAADIRASLRSGVVATTLRPPVSAPTPPVPLTKATGKVVIDPGHGGHDSGTTAAGRGRPEKDINLAVAMAVADDLRRRGVDVVCTRTDDRFIELDDRCGVANRSGARLFVSIHVDSNKSTDEGHTVITPDVPSPEANAAAHAISQRLEAAGSTCHSVRRDVRHLRVLSATRIPAVLIELGFLSNPREAARLCDPAWQHRMADAIAEGIAIHLNRR
ncbi:MAG: N-acetylmuramoyl-L-alanine amidase [Phycisphaerae bacterium]